MSYFNLATQDPIPETIFVREVFAIGHTRTAKELTAVAQIPTSRIVRGLGLLTENIAADAMSPSRRATLRPCQLWLTFARYWIEPMNGSHTFKPRIRCRRPAQRACMHGGSCCPQVPELLACATHVLLLLDMIRCLCSSKRHKLAALAPTHWAEWKGW